MKARTKNLWGGGTPVVPVFSTGKMPVVPVEPPRWRLSQSAAVAGRPPYRRVFCGFIETALAVGRDDGFHVGWIVDKFEEV